MTSSLTSGRTCPHCGQPYKLMEIPALAGGKTHYMTLECTCEGAERERDEERREMRSVQLHSAWVNTGAPARYLGVKPDMDSLKLLEDGRGLYLYGDRGTGKTRHACEVLKAYVSRNTSSSGWCSARFISTTRWLDEIRDAFGKRGVSTGDVYKRAAGVGLLVLDDFGKVDSDMPTWALSKLWSLVDQRYGDMLPTIFTSRFGISELVNRLSSTDRLTAGDMASRIIETCELVRYEGPDRRLK